MTLHFLDLAIAAKEPSKRTEYDLSVKICLNKIVCANMTKNKKNNHKSLIYFKFNSNFFSSGYILESKLLLPFIIRYVLISRIVFRNAALSYGYIVIPWVSQAPIYDVIYILSLYDNFRAVFDQRLWVCLFQPARSLSIRPCCIWISLTQISSNKSSK